MAKLSSKQAQSRFGELIDVAQHEPVVIERHGRPIAVVLSVQDYERLEAAQDRLWAERAEKALERGFASKEETKKLFEDIIGACPE
ncbi:MAG: type II toxin-antitoxin system Phd/YefM family antitoxin [Armatimonadota bacterium]|nr:type II toxin-antitoxin system Phd/YefM family antitoxin [Armatimonadota bacterium]